MKSPKILFFFLLSLIVNELFAQEGIALARLGKFWGMVDASGKEIMEPQLILVPEFHFYNGKVSCKNKEGKLGFASVKGDFMEVKDIKQITSYSEGLAAVRGNSGTWGFVNLTGELAIPFKFQAVKPFQNGKTWVKDNNNWTMIDKTGKQILKDSYFKYYDYENGIARVKQTPDGLWGYIDEAGNNVAGGFIYEQNKSFANGFACVSKDGMWGVIDAQGKFVVPASYTKMEGHLIKGNAVVHQNERVGLIDKDAKLIVPLKYNRISMGEDGYGSVELEGKWGFIDESGKEIVAPKFDKVYTISDGYFRVMQDGKWGFMNPAGEIKVLGKYESIKEFRNGLAPVSKDGKWGFVDKEMNEVIAPKYVIVHHFDTEWAVVKEEELYGYIDKKGNYMIQPKFEKAGLFAESITNAQEFDSKLDYEGKTMMNVGLFGLSTHIFDEQDLKLIQIAEVKYQGKVAFINKKGEFILKDLDGAGTFINGYCWIKQKGKYGFIDTTGKIVVPAKYTTVKDMTKL